MKKALTLAIVFSILVIATPVNAAPVTFVVDDDGADCPDYTHNTIQAAVDAAASGDTIAVCTGTYAGAIVDKTLHFIARGNVLINDGPNSHSFLRAGFLFEGEGAGTGSSITGFQFQGAPQSGYVDDGYLDFPVFSRGANNVTVEKNIMVDSLQAITNWGGSDWTIRRNSIEGLWTLNGGGIGILIGDSLATSGGVNGNEISHNEVGGMLHVCECDQGGYAATGIVLYADFRYYYGAEKITGNQMLRNKVGLVSDNPDVVDVWAIELTDTRDDPDIDPPVIRDNYVGFNDLRGTENQISLTPENLEDANIISRNLGDSRGHGLHPSVFGP